MGTTELRSIFMSRTLMLLLLVVVSSPLASSKDKTKTLPAQVLQAQTILVVISPDAGEPVTDPTANRNAREDVEKALTQWGRFRLAMEPHTADLVLSLRKGTGRNATPTISGGPIDNRPVILQPGSEGGIRIGGQHGRPDPVTTSDPPARPSLGTEIGASEDTLELYLGGNDYPLDSSPIWRYSAKDALHPPKIPGIEELRKAINETEKATQQKKKP